MKPSVKLACAAAIAFGGSISTIQTSNALPLAPLDQSSASPLVQDVRWGCGPGWHPDPWGRCVPNWRGGGWHGGPGWYGRSGWHGGWRGGGHGWHGGHGGGWHGGHGGGWHGGHGGHRW